MTITNTTPHTNIDDLLGDRKELVVTTVMGIMKADIAEDMELLPPGLAKVALSNAIKAAERIILAVLETSGWRPPTLSPQDLACEPGEIVVTIDQHVLEEIIDHAKFGIDCGLIEWTSGSEYDEAMALIPQAWEACENAYDPRRAPNDMTAGRS
ncbi:MAG: hypothetical protein FWD75_06625 [Propionibacteriaceae bacterium]|nr:hypothetical protein [Propionibacteriaceae bacterium]